MVMIVMMVVVMMVTMVDVKIVGVKDDDRGGYNYGDDVVQ